MFDGIDDTTYGVSALCATATGWSLKYFIASDLKTAETKKQSISKWMTILVKCRCLLGVDAI